MMSPANPAPAPLLPGERTGTSSVNIVTPEETSNKKQKTTDERDESKSLVNYTGAANMDISTSTALVARSAGGSGGEVVNSETPVDMKVPREFMPFTETKTALLPLTIYWSHYGILNDFGSNDYTIQGGSQYVHMIRLRMNDPLNLLAGMQFRNSQIGGLTGRGTNIRPINAAGNIEGDREFPNQMILNGSPAVGAFANADTRPGMWLWYAKQYQHYHVIKTKYKLTFENPKIQTGNNNRENVTLFYQHDVLTAQDSTNLMPRSDAHTRYWHLQHWKRVNQKYVNGERDSNGYTSPYQIISGEWEYGKWKGNTTNQEEIKTWYPTALEGGSTTISPSWQEDLVIVPRMEEFNTSALGALNVKCEILYEVQFKDLKPKWRYPLHNAQVDQTQSINSYIGEVLIMPNDMRQYPISL